MFVLKQWTTGKYIFTIVLFLHLVSVTALTCEPVCCWLVLTLCPGATPQHSAVSLSRLGDHLLCWLTDLHSIT